MATKLLTVLLLAAHLLNAQQGAITLRPALGLQSPLSKEIYNGFTKGKIKNNSFEEEVYYGLGVEYELKNNRKISLTLMNGNSGYSLKLTPLPCNNGYSGAYRAKEKKSAYFNNPRVVFGYQVPVFRQNISNGVAISVKAGLGVDFKSREDSDSKLIFPGINLCGETYYLIDSVFHRKNISYVLPLEVNFDWIHKKKKRMRLSLFMNQGLSKSVFFDIYYVNVTLGNRELATVYSRGSSYGMSISYPIRVYRLKKNV